MVGSLLLTYEIAEGNALRRSERDRAFTPYMYIIKANNHVPLKIAPKHESISRVTLDN